MDSLGLSKRTRIIAFSILATLFVLHSLYYTGYVTTIVRKARSHLSHRNFSRLKASSELIRLRSPTPFSPSSSPLPSLSPSTGPNTYGIISSKVAVITDTNYTPRLIPLILHFHSVLGPDWPIIFSTSAETREKHFSWDTKSGNNTGSAIWQRAVEDKRIEVRTLPNDVDLTTRLGVNLYLSRPVCEVCR